MTLHSTPSFNIFDFDYHLPTSRIAFMPESHREESKLMIIKKLSGNIEHSVFKEIAIHLPKNSLFIRNNTQVIHARLFMKKPTGGKVEVMLLSPQTTYYDALHSTNECVWNVLIGGKKIREDMCLELPTLKAFVIEKTNQHAVAKFMWNTGKPFFQIIEECGRIPLPPYIKRDPNEFDTITYQTIYSTIQGSVAAPTAGLHFTEHIFEELKKKNITIDDVTLHIGLGTFQPVVGNIEYHQMHSETFIVSKQTILNILHALQSQTPILSLGTTSLRTLESLYWLGVKSMLAKKLSLSLLQWECYQLPQNISPCSAFEYLLEKITDEHLDVFSGNTSILIAPPYQCRTIYGLVTNFHQPKSTLLLLVATLLGKSLQEKVYQEAIEHHYRFLSYGDGSLMLLE